jgi:hypothetical protein
MCVDCVLASLRMAQVDLGRQNPSLRWFSHNNGILSLYEPRPLSVDVLSACFDVLSDCIPFYDGLLFLLVPPYFLLNPSHLLLLCCGFVFFSFIIQILHLDLIKLSVTLNDLYW